MKKIREEKLMTESVKFDVEKVKVDDNLALNFIEYLKNNKMSINDNKIKYKAKRVGVFSLNKNNDQSLVIFTQFDEYLEELLSEETDEIKYFVANQIGSNICERCITGKCACTCISFINPNELLYAFAKKLITLRLDAIINDRVPKCNYIKLSDRGKKIKCAKCKICNPACRKLKNF